MLVAYCGLPSLAVTLGTLGAYRGLAYLIAGDAGVTGITPEYLCSATVGRHRSLVGDSRSRGRGGVLGAHVRTAFGRHSYAIGSSAAAARMAGVRSAGRVGAYALAGAMSGLAGLVWVASTNRRAATMPTARSCSCSRRSCSAECPSGAAAARPWASCSRLPARHDPDRYELANVPGTSQTLVVGALLISQHRRPEDRDLLRQRAEQAQFDGRFPPRARLTATRRSDQPVLREQPDKERRRKVRTQRQRKSRGSRARGAGILAGCTSTAPRLRQPTARPTPSAAERRHEAPRK